MREFALEIQNGPYAGQTIRLPDGSFLLGRGPDADMGIVHDTVSKAHAELTVGAGHVVVSDRGSTNGTWVNGRRIARATPLANQDVLRLGEVILRCLGPDAAAGFGGQSVKVGDVDGPVQTGDGRLHTAGRDGQWTEVAGNYSVHHRVGNDYVAGRDQHVGDRYGDVNLDMDLGLNEPFEGKGVGVVIMWTGLVVTLAGFAVFASVIFAFFEDVQSGFASDDPFADGAVPFDTKVLGLPALPLGFGMFVCGTAMTVLGRGMSMAAKRRERRAADSRRR